MTNQTNQQTSSLKAAQKTFEEIQQNYEDDPRAKTANVLVWGDFGSGKTHFAGTGRAPVLVHSFDPGGTTTLRPLIERGLVHADTRWEQQQSPQDLKKTQRTAVNPNIFPKWVDEINRLDEEGIFNHVGTFVIDSLTTWLETVLAFVTKRQGRIGKGLRRQDWGENRTKVKQIISNLTTLPCNVVLTAHVELERNEQTGELKALPMAYGKLSGEIPLMFDEVYFMEQEEAEGNDNKHFLYTQKHDIYDARSRLAASMNLPAKVEDPSLKKILKDAGLPWRRKKLEAKEA